MSAVMTLTEAMRSVGFCVKTPLPFSNNLSLRLENTGIQIVDWNYEASPADSESGSLLSDGAPLVYDFTA